MSQDKDPYKPISKMECQPRVLNAALLGVFVVGLFGCFFSATWQL